MIKIGQIIGRLTAKFLIRDKVWHCECECGNTIEADQKDLEERKVKHCGVCKPVRQYTKRVKDNVNPRDSPEYKAWCKAVFERDKHRCVCCGKRGWLNAHHLNGWNWAVGQRYDVNNGVTLCAGKDSCHNRFHDQYGRGNNTRAQFYQFLRHNKRKKNGKKKRRS